MALDKPGLKYPAMHPRIPAAFDAEGSVFEAIAGHDQMVYHPYDSFACVLRFLQQAALDPDVVAIKQTLYRAAERPPFVKSILEARRLGKQVTAVVELKARFDEEQNINWAEGTRKSGCECCLRFCRTQDPREALSCCAPRGRRHAPLRAYRHG